MYASESASERASPSEGLSVEPHCMLSVALKISSHNTERNVKVNQIIVIDKCCSKQYTILKANQPVIMISKGPRDIIDWINGC